MKTATRNYDPRQLPIITCGEENLMAHQTTREKEKQRQAYLTGVVKRYNQRIADEKKKQKKK